MEVSKTSYAVRGLASFVFMLELALPLQAFIMPPVVTPSVSSPSAIGTVVTWTVRASDTNAGALWYRFRVRHADGNFTMVRDFGPSNTLDWTTIEREGIYAVEVAVRNQVTGEIAYTSAPYEMTSRVTDRTPIIGPTANPLVFIYSAPPCPIGGAMQVTFWGSDGQVPTSQSKPCLGLSASMNFYLAGMQSNTHYEVGYLVTTGKRWTYGPVLGLDSGAAPDVATQQPFPKQTVLQNSSIPEQDSILLQGPLGSRPFATNLSGNIVWYYPQNLSFLTRPDEGGLFFGIQNTGNDASGSLLRTFDLAGTTISETNAATVNTQLAALGKRQIGVFHHEARRLSDGNIATLATVEQILTDVQGPGPVDVIGDMVIVLDSNLQVVWTWDAFDHLDVTRKAVLGETCRGSGACMSHFLAPDGNDWTHANALEETPDGNLLFSSRHQDWLIKINYDHGNADGRILWRLGQDGDFTFSSDSPYPWFTHQHDANFLSDNTTLTLFDNGNTRKVADPTANSRGMVLSVDEPNRTVRTIFSQDLGVFSSAVGSAQVLPNGNYHFDAGFVNNNSAISFEIDQNGQTVRALQVAAPEYRTFRMADLYRPK